MRPVEDVTVKIKVACSWRDGDEKLAYLAGVKTTINIVREIVRADEAYAAASVLREIISSNTINGDVSVLLQRMNLFVEGVKFTDDVFVFPELMKNSQYRLAVQEMGPDMIVYYEYLGTGNFSQAKRGELFSRYLKYIEDTLESL